MSEPLLDKTTKKPCNAKVGGDISKEALLKLDILQPVLNDISRKKKQAEEWERRPKTVIGVLKEIKSETRVAITAVAAKQLIGDRYEVLVEYGAGITAEQADAAYEAAGCKMMDRAAVIAQSKVLFAINAPIDEFYLMRAKILISYVSSRVAENKRFLTSALDHGVTLCDMTLVPRTSIGQKLDVLSSQAKVGGHRAVVAATHAFGRFHQGEMTAAGKYPPSSTFILGVGVAGLAAIGTAAALRSQVKAWDVRDVAKDQAASLGASWVTVDFQENASAAGGYAKESSEEFAKAQQAAFKEEMRLSDIAITTAAIPGRAAPLLITKDMVKVMKPGSVIVDCAATTGGGNCEWSKDCLGLAGAVDLASQGAIKISENMMKTPNNVIIICTGLPELAMEMAEQASGMYGQNMVNLVRHVHGKDKGEFLKKLEEAMDDEDGDIIPRSLPVCWNGQPHITPQPPANLGIQTKKATVKKEPKKTNPAQEAVTGTVMLCCVMVFVLMVGASGNIQVLRSFMLAGAAGYQAVWGVAHALHTPLMAVTNAISGLTALGGIEIFNAMFASATSASANNGQKIALALGALSVCVSTVNIVGGFAVTQRMLNLFQRKKDCSEVAITGASNASVNGKYSMEASGGFKNANGAMIVKDPKKKNLWKLTADKSKYQWEGALVVGEVTVFRWTPKGVEKWLEWLVRQDPESGYIKVGRQLTKDTLKTLNLTEFNKQQGLYQWTAEGEKQVARMEKESNLDSSTQTPVSIETLESYGLVQGKAMSFEDLVRSGDILETMEGMTWKDLTNPDEFCLVTKRDWKTIVLEDEDWTFWYLLLIPLLAGWGIMNPEKNIDVVESLCAVLCIFAIACVGTQKSANI